MISGYDIRENTLTPNSVFLLLLKADEQGCQDVLKDLSAFCKLIDVKVKGFDYVFELSGISDDSMLEKLRVKIDSLSSSFHTETFMKGDTQKDKNPVLTSKPVEMTFTKEEEGFSLPKMRTIEEEVITSLELKGESLSLAKDDTEKKQTESLSPVEKENQIVNPFTPEELKDVAISIEHKKSFFGGFFKKVKNALSSKKMKEEGTQGLKSLQEKSEKLLDKAKDMKGKISNSKLFKQAQELKEKVESSDIMKQAKELKGNIVEEINKGDKTEETKKVQEEEKNPFQDLGSGIIVKKALLQAEDTGKTIERLPTEINPIEAKMQVDDIFAAETVCSFYANNQEKPVDVNSNVNNAEKSPLDMLNGVQSKAEEKEKIFQDTELSKINVIVKPLEKTEAKPEEEKQEIKQEIKEQEQETEQEFPKEKVELSAKKKEGSKNDKTFYDLTEVLRTKARTESLFLNKEQEKVSDLEGTKANKEGETTLLSKEEVKEVFVKEKTPGTLDLGAGEALHLKTLHEEKKKPVEEDSQGNRKEDLENPFLLNTVGALGEDYKPLGADTKVSESGSDNKNGSNEENPFLLNTIGAYEDIKKGPAPRKITEEDLEIKNVWDKKTEKKEEDIFDKINAMDNQSKKTSPLEKTRTVLQPKILPEKKKIEDIQIPLETDISSKENKQEENFQEDKKAGNREVKQNIEQGIQKGKKPEEILKEKEAPTEKKGVSLSEKIKTLLKKKSEAKSNTNIQQEIKKEEIKTSAVIKNKEEDKGKEVLEKVIADEKKKETKIPGKANVLEKAINPEETKTPVKTKPKEKTIIKDNKPETKISENPKVSNKVKSPEKVEADVKKVFSENKKEENQKEEKNLQSIKENRKETSVMQAENQENKVQSPQGQKEVKPFQQISKNLATKNYGNIDHTLHIATPSQGVKSKNYPIEMPLIPTYTFANMDNSPIRFAHAMGMATLENLGTANNPLLLQGDSGTGKTHFLHAMGYEISKKIPQAKILFTNGVRFSRGIQCSLERGKKEKLDEFFQNVEVLIIDDIHLTAVNEHNREYISKILNDFLKNKKQIILASKYPPESLKRFEELVNFKLSMGAVAELKVPNQMHFSRLTKKMITNADLSLTEDKIQEFFFEGNKSLGDVAKEIKRVKVLSRRIESSGLKKLTYENILTAMTRINGEDPNSEIVKKEFEEITSLQKHKGYIWGNFGFFFPSSEINKFRWVAFASQEAAKELGIKGGFNYALKSAYSTEHIISAAFKIANICDVKGLKGAVILGPSLTECKEPIRENFYDILTHMLEVMMIRCGTINFEDIKKPSAYVKMLGDILR